MKKTFVSLSLMATLLLGIFSSCGEIKRGENTKGVTTVFCEDGFKNILEEEIEVFEYQYHDSSIIPKYMSEEDAIDSLLADKTETIIITKPLTDQQIAEMRSAYKKVVKQKEIAVDAVALIVNKDNPLEEISVEELGKILRGDITKWTQLVVNDTTPIKLVFDNQGSSTVNYLRNKFLDGKPISSNPNVQAFAQKNNLQVFDVVKKDKNAIGIISVSWLGDTLQNAKKVPLEDRLEMYKESDKPVAVNLTTEVKVLKVSDPNPNNDYNTGAYRPYQKYIESGEYPLYRTVWMITTGSSGHLAKSFYDFVTGFVGQKIISMTGVLPFLVNKRIVELQK